MKESSPWMTRREAAEYLRVSTDTIDRKAVEFQQDRADGRIRYRRVSFGECGPVRLLAEDVYALLPLPEPEEA